MAGDRWIAWFNQALRKNRSKPGSRIRRMKLRFLPLLECLEQRHTPTTLTLTSSADNTLYEDTNGQLSDGAGQHFYVGNSKQVAASNLRRAVLKFDLSAVPAGATINSATLSLHMSKTNNGAQAVDVHRALSAWGEGTSNAALGGTGSG